MKDLLYYPNFESTNENWLKFALLYIDKINPIVPPNADGQFSLLYQKLIGETDLIKMYRPEINQGYSSTIGAIEITEKIIANPSRYQLMLSQINPVRTWKRKENHDYHLFEAKFTPDWEHFCLKNGFATKVNEGVLLPETLGRVYMTILANTIGDATGKPLITDKNQVDALSLHLKALAPKTIQEIEVAQSIIGLKLPASLSKVPLDRIIKLRSSSDFKKHLGAFHTEQQNFYQNLEQGTSDTAFVKKYEKTYNDHLESILSISADTAIYGFGAGLVLQQGYTETDFYKVLAGALGLMIKSTFTLKKSWKNTASQRHCRRYLQDISSLNDK